MAASRSTLPEIDVELLELSVARGGDRLLERVGERARRAATGSLASVGHVGPASTTLVMGGPGRVAGSASGRRRLLGLADDPPIGAGGGVEPVKVAVRAPDDARVQIVERRKVLSPEHPVPHSVHRFEDGWVEDAVVGARLEVHSAAGCKVAARRDACCHARDHLFRERGQDHVDDCSLQRSPDEPAAQRVGREVADPVRFHPRLLEQSPVHRELPVARVLRFRQGNVMLDRPALGVLGVERLVQRDPEGPQDRPLLERAGGDRLARAEQGIGVEVDGAGVDFDVPWVRQPGAEQRPHGVQALEDLGPVVRQVLVDGIEPTALRGRAVQLMCEQPWPHTGSAGGAHEVTARG